MKHFYLKNILLCLLSFTGLGISAHDFYVDGIYYNITSEKDLTVAVTYRGTYYDRYKIEYTGSVTIPETVFYDGRTYSVTSIGYGAFYGCSGLTSVTIPNSVTSIGNGAFRGCKGLTTPIYNSTCFVFMPSSYTGTFTIPSGIKTIIGYAFYNCSGLTSVTIPNSVTSIGYGAFYN